MVRMIISKRMTTKRWKTNENIRKHLFRFTHHIFVANAVDEWFVAAFSVSCANISSLTNKS